MDLPPSYTPAEVAELLRVKADTVVGWIRAGRLRGWRLSNGPRGRWRITAESVERFIGRAVPRTRQVDEVMERSRKALAMMRPIKGSKT